MVSFFSKLLTALTHRLVEHRAAGRFKVPYLSDIFFWRPGRKNFQTILLIGGVQCVLHYLYFFFGGSPVSKPFKHYCMVARHAGLRDIASKKCPQTLRNARPMYSFTYVRTYVRTCRQLRTYVRRYVAGCVSHAVLSRCKRNRIYVGMYYVCTYVRTLSAS